MTASLQLYARATQIAIDTLAVSTDCTTMADGPEVTSLPEHGVYIHGLYFQGAGFDTKNMVLCESTPRQLFTLCPVVHLRPCLKEELATYIKEKNNYMCPCYKTSERKGTLPPPGTPPTSCSSATCRTPRRTPTTGSGGVSACWPCSTTRRTFDRRCVPGTWVMQEDPNGRD